MLDRFGLVVEIAGIHDVNGRVEVVSRRMRYDLDPDTFVGEWQPSESDTAARIVQARAMLPMVTITRKDMAAVATLSLELGVDGHRADLAILETARTHAAWAGRTLLAAEDIRVAAELALPHRMRRQPFTEVKLDEARVGEILDRVAAAEGDESAVANADGVKKKTP